MSATWRLSADPREFAAQAGRFIAAERERNVIATVAGDALAGAYRQTHFAWAGTPAGEIVAAGLRTAPWPLLVAGLDDQLAASLVAAWLERDPELPGVGGPAESSRALAGAWREATGGTTLLLMREAMHALSRVTPPARPASGELRLATLADLELLVAWEVAFRLEARVATSGEEERAVRRRIEKRAQYVWQDGAAVSTLGRSAAVARVTRIGPVYTPPEWRGRGYASAAVAAASQLALESDADTCMLLTDLANPTSNRIYAALGYRRFAEWEDHSFSLA